MSLDVLEATIARVIWTGPSRFNTSGVPFSILKLSGGQTAKGQMAKPVAGERVRLWGEWRPQKGYDEPAFSFESFETVIDESTVGMVDYLTHRIPGIGPAKAHAIVDEYGPATLTTLRTTPELLIGQVRGITDSHVEAIRKHFAGRMELDPAAYAKLIDLFAGNRVPKSIIKKLLKDFGSDAPTIITQRPYLLLRYPRMGWETVDSFATTIAGYDLAGIDRHKFAIVEAMERWSFAEGHTYSDRVDVDIAAFELLGSRPKAEAWEAAVTENLIIKLFDDDDGLAVMGAGEYALPKLAEAEWEIARCLARLAETAKPLPCEFDVSGLNDDQANALRMIEANGVAILTGPPGTGKSYSITKALAALVGSGVRSIHIATPTGKAAKRAAELLQGKLPASTDIPCTTIHRLLGPKPNDAEGPDVPASDARTGRGRDEFGFSHNENDPLAVDFLVIDESSMVYCSLGASLLRAVAPGTRVVFVGDHNQLPSVGPGSVLRDMMDAGLPTAILTQIQRNSGRIVRACHAIKDGQVPEPATTQNLEIGDNWIHIELDDPTEIAAKIVELHKVYRAFPDPVWDMQVVTPQKTRLPIACANLNNLLSAKLNNFGNVVKSDGSEGADDLLGGAADPSDDPFEAFRKGDKVIRTKNGLCDLMGEIANDPATGLPKRTDWRWDDSAWSFSETDIVNGDMGTVMDIVTSDGDTFVVVKFRTPERLCRLPYGECHLRRAYAITAHSAQGSGFPFVIIPVHSSFYWDNKKQRGIFNREWIYTAVSRAERFLITVGTFSSIRAAVGRKTVHRRQTKLAELIREHPAKLLHVSMADSHVEKADMDVLSELEL